MASKEMTLLPTSPPPPQNGVVSLNQPHQLLFQNAVSLHPFPPFNRSSADPGLKTTREFTAGFIDNPHRFFQQAVEFSRPVYATPVHAWNVNHGNGSDGDEDDEEDNDDDDDDDVDDDDVEVKLNESSDINSTSQNGKSIHLSSSFGSDRGLLAKERSVVATGSDGNDMGDCNNVGGSLCGNRGDQSVTIAGTDADMYYSQRYVQVQEGSTSMGQKDVSLGENGGGLSGRKDVLYSTESGESLRKVLSDPLTGSLMDDAMILPCGHSFGGAGMQHVIKMKACYTCSQPVSEDSVANNLSLRAAVQAFRREEEMQSHRASKRRKEKFEQDRSNYGDISLLDQQRGKGVQFPFSLTDRVIIKGNKRTPQRFVGREAVVTTQCLNGWYVVKTLDNAESVKLQYRSLAKVPDDVTAKPLSTILTPNWL
ncbi:U-box domain-containing protein 62 [Heracleum sosnowskyi]|uniref:U-box domain-containing protein 62 n=1 Tax=Heracleum sosnowskyi TaxID=360622 RepID=A0AAD8JAX2_9APIA|nr:U-box domain-containing protein 62 [Heracleum sosnowskyi]